MDNGKIKTFVKQLSKDTVQNKIFWKRLTSYENLDPRSNNELFNLLFQNEYRKIDYLSSYYSILPSGSVFVINETIESGRDGTLTNNYKLYLHNLMDRSIAPLPCDSVTIYQLLNAIRSSITKEESIAESFIDDYLSHD